MNTKALKQRILSLAISGKLVAQEPNDEPATELLKRLNPNAQPISTTEELPHGWCKILLTNICDCYQPKTISTRELKTNGKYNVYGANGIIGKYDSYNHEESELLLTCRGATCGAVNISKPKSWINGNAMVIHPLSDSINRSFLYYWLLAQKNTEGIITGTAQPQITRETLKILQLILPPIAEQKRIVQKIEELFAVIDTIEQNKQQLQNTIKVAKNKILSLAISGKLVAQEPNDEPATELLKRLNPNAQPISTTEELPHGWCKCKLEDVGNIITGSTPPKINNEYYGGNIPFFKPTDLEQGIDTRLSIDHLTEIGFEQSRKLPINTILVTCIGATIGKTGMTAVIGSCNQQINAIVPYAIMFPKYLYYLCISDFVQTQIKNKASATTLPILNKNTFSALEIPLPPIAEQKRIVQKIEELFALLDTLKISSEEQ